MSLVLWLLAIQGAIGAFDTAYYHEWRARLPAMGRAAAYELNLHAWLMAAGVFLSGLRDHYASRGLPHGGWPWSAMQRPARGVPR